MDLFALRDAGGKKLEPIYGDFAKLPKDFWENARSMERIPSCSVKFYAQSWDYGRRISLVETALSLEKEPEMRTRENICMTIVTPCELTDSQMLSGYEPAGACYKPEDIQRLMDALWAIGVRPSRG